MQQPLVSIIIPTLNRPEFLKQALNSVISQTYENWEAIIINDGGEDVSSVVHSFNNPKLHYLAHEIRKGLPAARNAGLRKAKGTYIAYLDDDDIYYPNHVKRMAEGLEDCDICYSDGLFCYKKPVGSQLECYKKEPHSPDYSLEKLLVDCHTPPLFFMHKASCLQTTGLFDESLNNHEDWDLWIRMFSHFSVSHVPEITGEYTILKDLQHPGLSSWNTWVGYFLHSMQIIHARYQPIACQFSEMPLKQFERRELLRKWCLMELDNMTDEQLAQVKPAFIMEKIAESSLLNTAQDVRGARALCGHLAKRLPHDPALWHIYERLSLILNDPFQADYARRQK